MTRLTDEQLAAIRERSKAFAARLKEHHLPPTIENKDRLALLDHIAAIQDDAELGRMVGEMPEDSELCRTREADVQIGCARWMLHSPDHDASTGDTPKEALGGALQNVRRRCECGEAKEEVQR